LGLTAKRRSNCILLLAVLAKMCFFALFGAGSRKFDAFHECTIIHSYRYNQQQKLQTDQNVNVTGLYLSLITGHSE